MRQPQVGKWFFHIGITPDVVRYERGWRVFSLRCMKLKIEPPPGMRITKPMYRGFMFQIAIFVPFEAL